MSIWQIIAIIFQEDNIAKRRAELRAELGPKAGKTNTHHLKYFHLLFLIA